MAIAPAYSNPLYTLYRGDCLEVLPQLEDQSVDAIISDPIYPEISRSYGRINEADWTAMMHEVVRQSRRILKPHGSAVFVLQPNSRKVGSMRAWLWEFMAWVCHEWNMVQDVWWWNYTMIPCGAANNFGLMRNSIKVCVWVGEPQCYRNQDAVLWEESTYTTMRRAEARMKNVKQLSGNALSVNTPDRWHIYDASERRGGVIPFNLLPINNADPYQSAGFYGHGAGTPLALCDWWVRYITQPGYTVLDPFAGTSTVGVAAVKRGCHYIGIEKHQEWVDVSNKRLAETQPALVGEAV